jgi:hypothetical protein
MEQLILRQDIYHQSYHKLLQYLKRLPLPMLRRLLPK